MEDVPWTSARQRIETQREEDSARIVILPGDKIRLELRTQLEGRVAKAVHPHHPAYVVLIYPAESSHRRDAHEKHHRQDEDRDEDERSAEAIRLGEEGKRDPCSLTD